MLLEWCNDQLHDVIGFADSALARYLVHVGKTAKSWKGVWDVLQEGNAGVSTNTSSSSHLQQTFYKELFDKCQLASRSKQKQKNQKQQQQHDILSSSKKSTMNNADWVKKAQTYSLVEVDEKGEEDYDDRHGQDKPKQTVNAKEQQLRSSSSSKWDPAGAKERIKKRNEEVASGIIIRTIRRRQVIQMTARTRKFNNRYVDP